MVSNQLGQNDYNDWLIAQSPTLTTSGTSGQDKLVYPDDQSGSGLFCEVKELTSKEKRTLGYNVQDHSVTIKINEHPDIDTTMRLIDQQRSCIYTIETITWFPDRYEVQARRHQGIR